MAARYSTAAVSMGHLALKRTIRHAEANDLISRNVAALADTPKGQEGRPSKSLTLDQAMAVIAAAATVPVMELRPGLKDVRRPADLMHAYIVLSLLAGIRTEEARALRWNHVDLHGDPAPPLPSRRTSPSGAQCASTATPRPNDHAAPSASPPPVQALHAWTASQADERLTAGDDWQDTGLVFTTHHGAALDAANVRKMFKRVCTETGIGNGWTPRELRTSFVSLMSHHGVSIEEIAHLVGHASTRTTEIVYLANEPGLADARLASHEHQAAPAISGSAQRRPQHAKLRLSPHNHRAQHIGHTASVSRPPLRRQADPQQ
jgi:integrase